MIDNNKVEWFPCYFRKNNKDFSITLPNQGISNRLETIESKMNTMESQMDTIQINIDNRFTKIEDMLSKILLPQNE